MTDNGLFLDTVDRLAVSGPTVMNDLVLACTTLGDALAASPGTVTKGEEALKAYSDELDRTVALAWAITAVGSVREYHAVGVAMNVVATAVTGRHRPAGPVGEAVLARVTVAVITAALAWRRLSLWESVAGVRWSDGYGPSVSVLADTDLRHLTLFERGADASFTAHVSWLLSRPWRSSVGVLASDDNLRLAAAEADVLWGMLAAPEGNHERDVYSAGLAQDDRRVARQIIARARDVEQRSILASLFSVPSDKLDQRMEAAYGKLTVGDLPTSFARKLFSED